MATITRMRMLDDPDKAILSLAQGDLPLDEAPFDAWAHALGIEVDELLERLAALKDAGLIRAFKAILRHRQAGMQANAMVAWAVEPGRVSEVGDLLALEPSVTHCYERPAFGEYTLFSMIHARSQEELQTLIGRIAARIGNTRYQIYRSVTELKKSSMRYF